MKWVDIINETPIGDIHTHGDFSQVGSLRSDDLSLVTPKRQDKIKRVLEKAPVMIDLHFVNQPHPVDLGQHLDPARVNHAIGFVSAEDLRVHYGLTITPRSDAMNVVMIQNEGDDRVPLTPWIIAHRIGHLFYYTHRLAIEKLFTRFYGRLDGVQDEYQTAAGFYKVSWAALARVFGTTRACREGLIRTGRIGEWVYECFAQMCVTGSIRFNPAPPTIIDQKMTFQVEDAAYVDRAFTRLGDKMTDEFTQMLQESVGQIVVF